MEQSIIIAGFGGQGVLLGGIVLANAFMLNNKKVTWYPCYGAEMRGGAVNCEIVVSDEEVSSVHKNECDYLVALNDLSFEKFLPKVKKGGTVILNTSLVKECKPRNDINYVFEKITDTAKDAGDIRATNMVSLGVLSKICNYATVEGLKQAIEQVIPEAKIKLRELDVKAMLSGAK